MANKTPRIFIRNLDHLRTAREPVKSHYIAESFDDVSNAYGNLKAQIDDLTKKLAELQKAKG